MNVNFGHMIDCGFYINPLQPGGGGGQAPRDIHVPMSQRVFLRTFGLGQFCAAVGIEPFLTIVFEVIFRKVS